MRMREFDNIRHACGKIRSLTHSTAPHTKQEENMGLLLRCLLLLVLAVSAAHSQSSGMKRNQRCYMSVTHFAHAVCYSSLDCRGNELSVVLPEKSKSPEAVLLASECCSAGVRGLSYRPGEGEQCLNCYSESSPLSCMNRAWKLK